MILWYLIYITIIEDNLSDDRKRRSEQLLPTLRLGLAVLPNTRCIWPSSTQNLIKGNSERTADHLPRQTLKNTIR